VPGSLVFGAQTVATTSNARTVTLSNTGTGAFAIRGISTTGDFSQSNNCGATLAPGANCTLSVMFRPVVLGTRAGSVVVESDAPGSPHSVSLSGQGAAPPVPGLTLVPGAVAFPDTQVGMEAAGITVVARNTGNAPLLISVVEIVGSGFRVVVHDCSAPVAAGAECRIVVAFGPTTRGAASASLRVSSNAPLGPVTAELVGTGIPAPLGALSATPGSLAFDGQVIRSTSALKSLTLNNSGDAAVNVGAIQVAGDFFQTNDCGRLPIGGRCTVTVSFTPTAVGVRTGSLTITSDASNAVLEVGLSGTGQPLPAALVELSASSLSFGNTMVGSQLAGQSFTVRNPGTLPLALGAVSVVGDFEIASACPASLAAGDSCRVDVTFAPRVAGARAGTVTVQSNATNAPNGSSVGLSGTGCRLNFANRSLNLVCQ
jgi:hypothetical protein